MVELFSKISHPQILLLMGVCPVDDDQPLQLVFEHVHLGSLYDWMHKKVSLMFRTIDLVTGVLINICKVSNDKIIKL